MQFIYDLLPKTDAEYEEEVLNKKLYNETNTFIKTYFKLHKYDLEADKIYLFPEHRDILIIAAARVNNLSIMHTLLLSWGSNPNALYIRHPPPLHQAIMHGNYKMCKLLLDNGACVNGISKYSVYHDPALLIAAKFKKRTKIAKLLIEYGAHVNIRGLIAHTPIYEAVNNNNVGMVKLLLLNKASPDNDCQDLSETPAMASIPNLYLLRLLVRAGCYTKYLENIKCLGNKYIMYYNQTQWNFINYVYGITKCYNYLHNKKQLNKDKNHRQHIVWNIILRNIMPEIIPFKNLAEYIIDFGLKYR